MKKIICFMLSIILLFAFTGCGDKTVSSDENSKIALPNATVETKLEDFKYEKQSDGTVWVNYNGTDSEVVYPEEINGFKVTGIIPVSCWKNETLKKVTIPSSIKIIGARAFHECPNLTTVILNEGLTTIESLAFKDCPKLTGITLPNTLTLIGSQAFYGCNSLKSIHVTKGLKTLQDSNFSYTGIETVTFDEGIEEIGSNVFAATKISEISFPKSLKTLGYLSLGYNENLVNVKLNDGLETMDDQIFARCPKLTELIIPGTVKKATDLTFDLNENLKSVKFEGDAPEKFHDPDWPIKVSSKNYTIYYHEGAKGFTSPTWNGYKTEIW